MADNIAPWAEQTAMKAAFAAALLRYPNDAFKAASLVCGTDSGRALRMAWEWPNDPGVLEKQKELLEEYGEEHFAPTKAQASQKVYEIASDERVDAKVRLAAFDLFCRIKGFIQKPEGTVINNNNTVVNQNRVMLMRDHGTVEEWEEKLRAQQAKLVEHSRE